MPDEKRPIAENEVPNEDDLQHLIERAKSAWLNPLRTLAETYLRQARTTAEGILASLEKDDSPKTKEK